MTATAKQIVKEEVYAWLTREDYQGFLDGISRIERLEADTRIWEYAKWCCTKSGPSLWYKPQLVVPSPPGSTLWDGLPLMPDEEAMRIHAATVRLGQEDPRGLESIKALYLWRMTVVEAAKYMRMRTERFMELRLGALQKIRDNLLTRET